MMSNALIIAADKEIKIWDVFSGNILRTMVGHTEGLSDVAWSSNSEIIASASDDKTIRIWSVANVGLSQWLTL